MATGRVPTTANSPLTAKGDLFGYSTTQARVAVGSNGDSLVADSAATTGLRWQSAANSNSVINGGFDIWQRGTSIATATSATNYSADRWAAIRAANAASVTVSRQTTSDTTNLPFIQYCARVQRTASSATTDVPYLAQSFESASSIPFAGRTIVFSFYARAGANYSAASSALNFQVISGTGTDQNVYNGFTGAAAVINTTATLTTTWQRFQATATVSSSATQLGFYFYYTPVGTAGANDWFEITGVQLELGSVATTFKRAGGTLQGELAACQRYYWRTTSSATNYIFGLAQCYGTTTGGAVIPFPVPMRVRPTALEQSGTAGDYQVYTAAGAAQALTAVPTFAAVVTSQFQGAVNFTVAANLVAGNATQLTGANASAYLGWSAEL